MSLPIFSCVHSIGSNPFAMTIPTPSVDYRQKQTRLHAIMAKTNKTTADHDEQQKLYRELRTVFMEAFDLEPDTSKTTSRVLSLCAGSSKVDPHHLFDHPTCFRRDGNFFIVTQPYSLTLRDLQGWARAMANPTVALANEWGFYYPNEAKLGIVEFSPTQKKELQKKRRDVNWRPFPDYA
jgi:hypothetical protein